MNRRCIRCNVQVADDAIECPLCHGVLESTGEDSHSMDQQSVSLTYPDITGSVKRMQFIIRLIIFAAIVAEVVSLIVNYVTFNGVYWSLIVAVGLCYGIMTLLYSFRERRSLQRIVQVQMLLAIVLLIALDYILGGKGWSYLYALPILFVAVDIGMVVLMIVGIDGWQTYVMTEIVTMLLSLVLVILDLVGFIETSLFAIIALGATGLILLGTLMLGQRMISDEVRRRFRV